MSVENPCPFKVREGKVIVAAFRFEEDAEQFALENSSQLRTEHSIINFPREIRRFRNGMEITGKEVSK